MVVTAQQLAAYRQDPSLLIRERFVLPTGATYGEGGAPFQLELFDAAFARRPDSTPVYRLLYDERRRGESKTEDLAAIALADLFTGPVRHRSYAIAADEDQARLILDSVTGLTSRSPLLAGQLDTLKSTVRNKATMSELRVISSDDRTAFGIRPYRAYFDELSLQTDERLWTSIWSAIGKNPQSQMIAASMAGSDFTSVGWRIRELASSNARYYFASRQGSELAPWLSMEDYEEQRATLHPTDFAIYWECRWTEPKGSWITAEMYAVAEAGVPSLSSPREARCAGFVDVGLVHDATAVAVCHWEGEGGDGRVVLDAMDTLQGSRGEPVQLEVLEELVLRLTLQHNVQQWVFEAPQAVASVQRLEKLLPAFSRISARYPTADTQAELFGGLYRLFADHRLILFPHDQLKREALNLVTKSVGGRIKVLGSNAIHQDHVIALGGAAGLVTASHRRQAVMPPPPFSIRKGAGGSFMSQDQHVW